MPADTERPNPPTSAIFNPNKAEGAHTDAPPAPEEPGGSSPHPAPRDRGPDGRFLKAEKPNEISETTRNLAAKYGLDELDLDGLTESQARARIREERSEAHFKALNARLDSFEQQAKQARRFADANDVSSALPEKNPYHIESEILNPDFAVELNRHLAAIFGKFEARLKTLEEGQGKLASFHENQIKQQQEATIAQMDAALSKHPEYFGKGRFKDLSEDDQHFRAGAVAWIKKNGGSLATLDQDVERFLKHKFGQRQAPPPDDEPLDESAEDEMDRAYANGLGVLQRSTNKGQVPDPPSYEKAVIGVKEQMGKITNGQSPQRTSRTQFLRHTPSA